MRFTKASLLFPAAALFACNAALAQSPTYKVGRPPTEAELRAWHGAFQSEVYEGARHGWTTPGRGVYNELQAERAFEKLVELFDATLK